MSRRDGDDRAARDGSPSSTATAAADRSPGVAGGSCWPLVVAAGVAGCYAALALALLDAGLLAIAAGAGGLGLAVAGVAGWYWQGLGGGDASRRPARSECTSRASRAARSVAVLVVVAETATFGALLAGYLYPLVSPAATWRSPATDPVRTAALTLLLIAASSAVRAARTALDRGDRRTSRQSLRATVGLGVLFLVGLAGEYYTLASGDTGIGGGPGTSAFLGLGGLHGLHVLAGIAVVAVALARRDAGRPSAARRIVLPFASLYWYFVVGSWVAFVAALAVGTVVSGG